MIKCKKNIEFFNLYHYNYIRKQYFKNNKSNINILQKNENVNRDGDSETLNFHGINKPAPGSSRSRKAVDHEV